MTNAAIAAPAVKSAKPAPLWEILAVMIVSLGIGLIVPAMKGLSLLLQIGYMIIDARFRKRTWIELGFHVRAVPAALVKNIGWILLVGVIIQAVAVFGSYYLLPEYTRHVIERVPFDINSLNTGLFILLGVSILGEEVIYRALFQSRLADHLPAAAAILLSSLVFTLMHFAPGPALIVVIDLLFVFIDSVIFGMIFHRSRNVFVAWTAHFLGDIVALIFVLMMLQ